MAKTKMAPSMAMMMCSRMWRRWPGYAYIHTYIHT